MGRWVVMVVVMVMACQSRGNVGEMDGWMGMV